MSNQAVINQWSGSAPYWEKHREIIRQMFAPVTQALIEAAAIASGQSVLDVATGPGEPALGIAAAVGPQGKVVGIDPIPEMVAASRRAAELRGLANTQFEVAFADSLPFPADHFDAVVSRFGIMFAPSPVNAIREMLRTLKPGRKLALAVWHLPESNPFFYTLSKALAQFFEPAPPVPDAPDGYRFAAPGKLRALFDEAGANDSTEHALTFAIEAPVPVEDFFALRSEMSESARDKMAKLSPEQFGECRRAALEAMGEYATPSGMSFPAEVLIVTGSKAG